MCIFILEEILLIVETETMQFELKVSGSPVPTLTWFKNGTELKAGSDYKFISEGVQCRLVIFKPTIESAGKYTCKAENAAGIKECSAELTVTAKGMEHCRI